MYRSIIFLLPILLESLLLTPSALTVPSINPLIQHNRTSSPFLTINGHSHHRNLTDLPPLQCYWITDPPLSVLSDLKCAFLAEETCANLVSHGPEARDKWVWSEISGCALGYYLPDGAVVPNMYPCEELIFGRIRGQCPTTLYNAGSINVWDMPDFGSDGTGVIPSVGRYLMAPERLTL